MLNKRPVFINGLTRGGTTQVLSLLLSHPGLCACATETHHAFRGIGSCDPPWHILRKWICNQIPICRYAQLGVFSPRRLGRNRTLPAWAMQHFDRVLYRERLYATHEILNRYRTENTSYTREEIMGARLVSKNVNGIIFMTDMLASMYPDADFVGVIRHGLAVCEGNLRRGYDAADIGNMYQGLVTKMLDDAERLPRYHIVRFEDLLADPADFVERLYRKIGINTDDVPMFRLQRMRTIDSNGIHRLEEGREGQLLWCTLDQLRDHICRDVNANQIERLAPEDADSFMHAAEEVMSRLGYVDAHGQKQEVQTQTS